MMHPGKLITQQELIDHVWNGEAAVRNIGQWAQA